MLVAGQYVQLGKDLKRGSAGEPLHLQRGWGGCAVAIFGKQFDTAVLLGDGDSEFALAVGNQSWLDSKRESVTDGTRLEDGYADVAGDERHAAEGEQTMLVKQLEPETSWHWAYWALGKGAAIGAALPW